MIWWQKDDSEHYKDIENLFKETEFKFTHTINVNDKTVLFSHAGVLDDWYNLKDISELEENDFELNYNLYKEFVFLEQDYEPPLHLLEKLFTLENEIFETLEDLKKELL